MAGVSSVRSLRSALDAARIPIECRDEPLDYVGWMRVLLKAAREDPDALLRLYDAAQLEPPACLTRWSGGAGDRRREMGNRRRRQVVHVPYALAGEPWGGSVPTRLEQLLHERTEHLTAQEIAGILDVSSRTVTVAVHRLRERGAPIDTKFNPGRIASYRFNREIAAVGV